MSDERYLTPDLSRVEMTQLVMPGDTNSLGTAFGGRVLQWIDICAGVAARRHAGGVAVTASIDSVQFMRPIQHGDVVVLRGQVNRAWQSSMEVEVTVTCDSPPEEPPYHAVSAFLTFVAIDEHRRPRHVPRLLPRTDDEHERYAQAEQRRQQRLAARSSGNRVPPTEKVGS